MPGIHHRQINLSNLFGDPTPTREETSAIASATPSTTTTTNGGLLGGLSTLLNGGQSSTSTTATTESTTSAPPTTTTAPQTVSDITTTLFSTSTQQPSLSSSVSPSASTTDSPTVGKPSIVAAGVVGALVGVLAICMFVAFVLRRWNRNKRRATRESVNFNIDNFLAPRPPSKDELAPELKEPYGDAPNAAHQFPTNPAPVYPHDGGYHHQPQVYSPRPHHGYASEAQQVMYDYRGQEAAVGAGLYPNPHDAGYRGV
ncbi:hypothetical protein MKEN_00799800 [Mycena kentingensis (nom. inval.)]|nr:hypothetical protein MKEN_00799800 [Mycena kentingensis (nom. inval.)]